MKYEKKAEESYVIYKNDGSGPFEKIVNSILIFYNEDNKPVNAILTAETPMDEAIKHGGPLMRETKDLAELEKIVKFFKENPSKNNS